MYEMNILKHLFWLEITILSQVFDCHKLWCTSQIVKPEKISTKLGVDLYSRAKIQTFTPEEYS